MTESKASVEGLNLFAPNRLALAEKIHAGVRFAQVEAFLRKSGFSAQECASACEVAKRTWERRKEAGRFAPDESDRIARFVALVDHAAGVFGSATAARRWFGAPNLLLGGETPLAVARTDVGREEIAIALSRIEWGDAA
ncbi:MAG: type II RES/Xre toxin-antitoxin system antitoxin [Thermoplasmatota archaeon]